MANKGGEPAARAAVRHGGGPVAFKDAVDVDAAPVRPPTEHGAAVSALPAGVSYGQPMRCYGGTWVFESWAQGMMAMHRGSGLVPRASDVLLASLPKSGTTWLKALAFATTARRACPPPASPDHPLRRLNPHDCKDRLVSIWHFRKCDVPDLLLQEVYESICDGTGFAGPTQAECLKYEEVLRDPVNTIRELAQFVGQPFSDTEEEAGTVAEIVKLCSLESLRSQKANKEGIQGVYIKFSHDSYFRKGVEGDWRNHMTPEMAEMGEHLDSIIREKLDGSGLTI
uniref:Sulfotransferase n=1 Tax=Oryza barthii TaxID=65489 RepID=A0A0D3GXT7_9ORYZ